MTKVKEIDSLMEYLREQHNININGESQKLKLRNIGYYHGFKGYRYINNPNNKIQYSNFEEIMSINNFDMQLKSLLYPNIMFIETALKNYMLEILLQESNSENFNIIYTDLLNNHKDFSTVGKQYNDSKARQRAETKYKDALKKRLELRDRIYNVQTRAYANKNKIAVHFYQKDLNLPIWSIFELLSLGEFGHFVSCLNFDTRAAISKSLGIKQSDDTNALLTQRLIYCIKDLRNSIAHNDVIFDARFRSGNIDQQVISAITNATRISNITFNTVTDYIILVVYMLKMFGTEKNDMFNLINTFDKERENLRNKIPINIYNQIIHTDILAKLGTLKNFI